MLHFVGDHTVIIGRSRRWFRNAISMLTVGIMSFSDRFVELIKDGAPPNKWRLIASLVIVLGLMLNDLKSRITPTEDDE